MEHFHGTIKKEWAIIESGVWWVEKRLHSANAYIAPADQIAGRDNKIHEERRKKIDAARLKRKHNVLREEIKLNKLEYKLTSQKLYSYQL